MAKVSDTLVTKETNALQLGKYASSDVSKLVRPKENQMCGLYEDEGAEVIPDSEAEGVPGLFATDKP